MEKDKPEIPTLNLAAHQAVMNPILQYNRLLTFQNHLNHLALQLTAPALPTTVQPYRRECVVQTASSYYFLVAFYKS